MKVHYRKSIGLFYLVVGIIFSIYALLTLDQGTSAIIILGFGIGLILISIQLLAGCLFKLDEHKLIINSIIGIPMSTHQFESIKDLEIVDKTVYLYQNESLKKISLTAWMANQREWQAFVEKLGNPKIDE
ncbi:MAG: hypothetical protein JEZ00_15630 [Anaerolineaceae bacterium]|nr:hypothetical protein [Anaerolineaceae bacterium]